MRKEVEGLENHTHFCAQLGELATFFGQFFSVDMYRARGSSFEAVDGSAEG